MSSHYSRQQKPKKSASIPTKHIKTGFTALQKTIALVGSVLSIVVATITINRALQPSNEQPKSDSSPSSTSTIVKIIEKESSHSNKEETDKTETNSDSSGTQPTHTTPSSADPATKDTEKQQNTETEAPAANQPAANEPAPNSTSNP
ncbi:TPA: hypothetical protein TUM56_000273 [Streptococcus equi subsp. zooepidemicus]|uniref:Membrane protein n=2 Tax=Streptococcus equi subsp. zooepidemicus TaxID=40041 RepID=A0A7Z8ZWJ2_STRSZ|nr:DUF6556 family protein [Streptococcus equi]KIS13273.1 membrane protein [Streptococcus equi subsp. zooepidemicus Sz105]VED85437.1 membrane protein [Streptococcus equi subsp. equi]KIS14683.1 membrane protein [Streptococcus equi subsp. zooepidemicus SzAM60]KIS20547.1 membrane protein [Streptococcus equi subsp. zooepidemicus Sz35]MCD3367865.1 hypothetical protein [Streptococcus equi subsp. zooepidemicus]